MSAVPSGQYMGAIGKVVGMQGLGSTHVLSSTRVAQARLAQLGVRPAPSVRAVGIGGLGSAQDRAICQAAFAAGGAGGTVAGQMHQQSGGTDQGWSTGINIYNALMQAGGQFCNVIRVGDESSSTAAPSAQASALYDAPTPPSSPPWLMIGAVGVGALVVGALIFGR